MCIRDSRIVLGERGLDAGTCEYRHRRATDNQDIALADILEYLRTRLAA